MKNETKRVTVDLPAKTHRALKAWLSSRGITISEWVRDHASKDMASEKAVRS